jgi:hypothetical protein
VDLRFAFDKTPACWFVPPGKAVYFWYNNLKKIIHKLNSKNETGSKIDPRLPVCGSKVGNGWQNFKFVFAAPNGIIYAVQR